jgi:hypothetical protein
MKMTSSVFVLILLGPFVYDNDNLGQHGHRREARIYTFSEMLYCENAATAMYRAKDVLEAICVEIKIN